MLRNCGSENEHERASMREWQQQRGAGERRGGGEKALSFSRSDRLRRSGESSVTACSCSVLTSLHRHLSRRPSSQYHRYVLNTDILLFNTSTVYTYTSVTYLLAILCDSLNIITSYWAIMFFNLTPVLFIHIPQLRIYWYYFTIIYLTIILISPLHMKH